MELQFRRLLNMFVLLFVIISGALVYWQVYWPTSPPAAGQDQNNYLNYKPCTAATTPQRGNIYDRNGVLLAWSVRDPNSPCGWRREYATDKYPSIASFIGYYSPVYGTAGVERYYNDQLAGDVPPADFNQASSQYWNNILHMPTYGQNLYLSIDVRIQNAVDKVFQDDANTAQTCDGTQVGSIIVTDPHTGQILAMVSRPYANPNTIGDTTPAQDNPNTTVGAEYWNKIVADPCAPLLNRAVQGQYAPGSIFKTVTLLAGLNSGQYTINSGFSQADATSVTVDGHQYTADPVGEFGRGPEPPTFPMDLAHAYAYSDNVVFARLAVAEGTDTWVNFAKLYQMSTPGDVVPAPIDIKEAAPSYIYVHGSMYPTLLAESGYGQGQLFLTPLTMSMVTNSVAADGMLYAPRLGLKLVPHGVDPNSVPNNAPVVLDGGPIFSAQTAQGVRQGMRDDVVFGTVGASGSAWSPVYNSPALIGGKTGTAQTSGNFSTDSFISLAPDDAAGGGPAQLTVTIMKENGTEGAYEALIAPEIYSAALPLLGH